MPAVTEAAGMVMECFSRMVHPRKIRPALVCLQVVDWCRPHTPLTVQPVWKGHAALASTHHGAPSPPQGALLPQIGQREDAP
eukprot:540740-Amphidinium_carterae.1